MRQRGGYKVSPTYRLNQLIRAVDEANNIQDLRRALDDAYAHERPKLTVPQMKRVIEFIYTEIHGMPIEWENDSLQLLSTTTDTDNEEDSYG